MMTFVPDGCTKIESYTDLVGFLFDENLGSTEWYFSDEFIEPIVSMQELPLLITRMYSDIEMLNSIEDESVLYHGLNYTMNSSCGDFAYIYSLESIDEKTKSDYVESMYKLFEGVFSKRCSNELGHLKLAESKCNNYNNYKSLNMLCYMWWDIFPRHGTPYKENLKHFDLDVLNCLERLLKLDSIACKESALHGLGHWAASYPERVQEIILKSKQFIPNELIEYSKNVITGHVQ